MIVNKQYCIGCGICTKLVPEVYELVNQKASVRIENISPVNKNKLEQSMEKCPVKAITINIKDKVLTFF